MDGVVFIEQIPGDQFYNWDTNVIILVLLLSCNLQQIMNHVSTIILITSGDPAWLETNTVECIALAPGLV